ncbi:armadillo-type protein [Helicostylum pulchrum]|nr:armadillo-type protein [Helicostylum pulchrum]
MASSSNSPSSSSAAAAVLDYSDTSQPQYKILNRMSTLFGGKKKLVSTSSVLPDNDNDTLVNPISQVDSMFTDEVNNSCVDSMYSSLQSRSSRYRPSPVVNSDAPAPLRTVQLMDPIVHLPEPITTTTTPSPPPPAQSPPPTTQKSFDSPPSPPQEQRKSSPPPGTSTQKIEDVEAQFKLLLREYAPSADHMSNVHNLTFEQKEMLLRSSRSPALLKKNSTFSHVMPSFSLKATFGLKPKTTTRQYKQPKHEPAYLSEPSSSQDSVIFNTASTSMMTEKQLNSLKQNHTAPGRYGRPRSSLPNSPESYGKSTSRSKLKSTPEYFVHLLRETHVRDLDDAEVLDLRVFLRSVVVSWTSEFLAQGGYEAIANLFKEMKEAPKRFPNDNRMLQHLGKCLKTIMTHQSMGTQIVLTNPSALFHIRDILFGPASKKQKQVYGLDISTRSLLLNLLCTLATLQTNRSPDIEYVHGYDVLRRLLLDRPTDRLYEEEDKKNQPKHISPFPISLKTDPKEILQMIMENDPNGETIGKEYEWDHDELKPRYTCWMRELQYTVERHIETITFLAQVLNYDFKSAYRQIRMRQSQSEQEARAASNPEADGAVMTEEGVVDYIITHLRLIRTVVTTQPTTYTGYYDEREQEKMRLELMLSGFDKISKILIQCPHPTVRSSYINYLKPLMNPCADLSMPIGRVDDKPPPLPSRAEEDGHSDEYDISVYPDELDGIGYQDSDTEELVWRHEEEPTYDDIFQEDEYIEDHFNSDEEVSDVSGSNIYYTNDDDSLYSRESYTIQPVTTGSKPTATTRVIQLGDNSTEHI